jgi:hypothetical protein
MKLCCVKHYLCEKFHEMPRKKWSVTTDITPALLKSREKRKWQIALRRYVIEKNISAFYAPYFGLDIENMRKWVEIQFEKNINWSDFGKKWHLDHVVHIYYFNSSDESELKLCWNFINIRVAQIKQTSHNGNQLNVSLAKNYFDQLYNTTFYPPCRAMLEKLARIESSLTVNTENQQGFINEYKPYLELIKDYSMFEFELLNSGRSINDVNKEVQILKKFEN